MSVRCKFRCYFVETHGEGENKVDLVRMNAVIDGSEENKQFFRFTPGGSFDIYNSNPSNKFEIGKEYYLDITEVG
jgi:hypothetical protein